jgi:hypothetical protein
MATTTMRICSYIIATIKILYTQVRIFLVTSHVSGCAHIFLAMPVHFRLYPSGHVFLVISSYFPGCQHLSQGTNTIPRVPTPFPGSRLLSQGANTISRVPAPLPRRWYLPQGANTLKCNRKGRCCRRGWFVPGE